MKRVMSSLAIMLILSTSPIHASDELESDYRKRYWDEMYNRFSDAIDRGVFLANYNKDDAKLRIGIYVSLMADCQVKQFDHFLPKYRQLAYREVANGKSIADSQATIQYEMLLDIKMGSTTQKELERKGKIALEELESCQKKSMSKAGL